MEVSKGEGQAQFSLSEDGILFFKACKAIPDDPEIIQWILVEAHSTPYAMHPSRTKMY